MSQQTPDDLWKATLGELEVQVSRANYNTWLILLLPFAAFTFLFASTAEINRTPNDIGEAESEIVAGFYTEYSGMKAGLFMGVELGNAILVGAMMSTFFLGGYTLFGLETWIPGYLILTTKIGLVYFLFVWLRGTLPRLRIDQLMAFAWKMLIPFSFLNLILTAWALVYGEGLPSLLPFMHPTASWLIVAGSVATVLFAYAVHRQTRGTT